MKRIHLLSVLLALAATFIATAQTRPSQTPVTKPSSVNFGGQGKSGHSSGTPLRPTGGADVKREQKGSSFFYRWTEDQGMKPEAFLEQLPQELGLRDADRFTQFNSEEDMIGMTHYRFRQYHKGIEVHGGNLLMHVKGSTLISANGHFHAGLNISPNPTLTSEQAIEAAKEHFPSEKYHWEDEGSEAFIKGLTEDPHATHFPDPKLIIAPMDGIEEKGDFRLCYRMTISTLEPYEMWDVFIDARTGERVNAITHICHADAVGTGVTYYSGTRQITTDSNNGQYRLRESGRNIHTYNMNGGTDFNAASDYSDVDNNWQGVPLLQSITITNASNSWWYTWLTDEIPDFFVKVYDGSNNLLGTTAYLDDDWPSVTFSNLNVPLTNGTYRFEIWDYDAANGNDYGGSYTISTNIGTNSFSGNGNSGNFTITQLGHPAIDVHWGMEIAYDYYLQKHNRDSYDGQGSVIRNYTNLNSDPSSLPNAPGWPNNAFALQAPYNIMVYGFGDGYNLGPVVGLDVEIHEFSHLVTANNGNGGLTYQGESGALNESFSDIFATAAEINSGVNPDWTIGEDIMIQVPFMRSMSNPNSASQPHPDTYTGQHWVNPTSSQDNGGVHSNSGVQNFWFYLLVNGGTGTNDIGNSYNVTGIGMSAAERIAFRNLMLYLPPNATFYDAYQGSLYAATDLFGAGSQQYQSVANAWYAVGIGTGYSTTFCQGTTERYEQSGVISDGSGSANYANFANCSWVIQPVGADYVTLQFTAFDTEAGYDSVMVYDGPDNTYPLLMTWWGNTLPSLITSTSGALYVEFISDNTITAGGWQATFTGYGNYYCDGLVYTLTAQSGTFTDGSASNQYGNNQFCYWYISPPGATSITLSFPVFNTENGYDGVIVYDGLTTSDPVLLNWSGTSVPTSVTSSGGQMLVTFVSDHSVKYQGFTANYNTTGAPFCSGNTNMTAEYGSLSDGSGNPNYYNNSNCTWLIQPTGASSVILTFTAMDVEPPSSDGLSIYDAVEVYDGSNANAPLLGRFMGGTIPPPITSSGGSLFVKFFSDLIETRGGWDAYYTSSYTDYCNGTTTLTAPSGTFADGSASNLYNNNADCYWLIQPPGVSSISLDFPSFATEQGYDGVTVFDGATTAAPVLGQFTGSTVPQTLSSTQGVMLVHFAADETIRQQGWTATYNAIVTSVDDVEQLFDVSIRPNPFTDRTVIDFGRTLKGEFDLEVVDVVGRSVLRLASVSGAQATIEADKLGKGVYTAYLKNETERQLVGKMVVQ
jgi:Zn-dependent metalloprotease